MKTFNSLNPHRLALSARLLISSQDNLIKTGLLALPIIIFIAITLSLQLNGLLRVNSHHLEAGYIGLQGRLSLSATPEVLSHIAQQTQEQGFSNLLKRDEKRLLRFQVRAQTVSKFIRLQTLTDSDYAKRFPSINNLDSPDNFVANRILQRHFMDNTALISGIYYQQPEHSLTITQLFFIDTGFLTTEPMLYIRQSQYQTLTGESFPEYNTLEFTQVSEHNIHTIKELIAESATQLSHAQINIHDLLIDTRESREFFEQLEQVQWVLICIVLAFVVLTIISAVGIILALKRKSFYTLMLLGLSKKELATHVSLLSTIAFLISTGLAISLYFLSFDRLLAYLDIPSVNFVPFGAGSSLLIISFVVITSCMTFYSVYNNQHS